MKPEILNALSILESEPHNADALAALAAAAEGGGNGQSDPAAERALAESRRVHRERGDHDVTLRLYDLELGWQKDPGKRADLLVEKAKVLSEELWRDGEAQAAYEKAVEARPGDENATAALAQMALVKENWTKIAKKYSDEVKAATDKQLSASLLVSLAEIHAKHHGDEGRAEVEAHLRKAVETDPRNKKAALHLERLLRDARRWPELMGFLSGRADLLVAKEEKLAALLSLADVARDHLSRGDLHVETMKKVLAIDPLNSRAMKALSDSYSSTENWQSLYKLYENALKARPRGDAESAIILQLGLVAWKKLANLDLAEAEFRKIRQKEPAHALALDFYRAYYTAKNDPPKLLQTLQQAQKAEPDEKKRLALAIEMAHVAESSAGSVEKAVDIWKGVFKLDKTNVEAATSLKRLYQKTEKWNALLELLKEQVEALPKDPSSLDARIERLLEVVGIYRDKLNLDVMVINTYNAILALKADHGGALDALAAKYEAMGRWNDLIGVLQRQADATTAVDAKAKLLRRVATLWVEKFGNHNQAVKPLEELYALAPGDADVVARLRDIYSKRRAWRALLDLERRELDLLSGEPRRNKLMEMAKLAAERLGDAREAIALWNRILEDDPSDPEAVGALVVLYERDKRYPALVEMLQRQRLSMEDPKLQLPLLEKIGTLWSEKLAAPHKAIEAYQQILKLVPGHPKTQRMLRDLFAQAGDYSQLESLYVGSGQFEELCETLLGVAERATDTAQKLALYRRAAGIAENELKAPERAAKAYERILAVDETNLEAARALVPIYRKTEKWARLLATYEILLGHARTDDERLALHGDIRVLCEEKLGSKQLAFTWCAKAFALRPGDETIEKELERLARDADAWDQLVDLYATQAKSLGEGPKKVARLRQVADLYLSKLNRADDARRYYTEVLDRVPGDVQALAALEQVHTHAGNWKELLSIYRQRVTSTDDRDRRVELLYKIAFIEEEKGNQLDEAASSYRKILEEEPAATRALRALERIYGARSNWTGLVEVLRKQLDLIDNDVDTEVALSFQLGELHELKLNKPDAALPYYQRAFSRQGIHRPTLGALERYLAPGNPARVDVARLLAPVYEKADEAAQLAETLVILLEATKEREEELGLLKRLATLVGRRLGDVDAAFAYALRIFDLTPGDPAVRTELRELSDLLDNHAELAKRLGAAEEHAAKLSDKMLARDLAWEMAQLFDDRLGDEKGAEAACRRVLSYDEGHDGALRSLERMYQQGERWQELRALLVKRKELTLDAGDKRELLFQICDLDEGVLADQAAAARDYLEVLDLDPASQRAFKALERIYAVGEQWKELDTLLGRAVPYAEKADERAQLKSRRAEIHATRLEDFSGACELFDEALAEDPKNDAARKGLERLMARPELRLRIARTLEPLYATDEAWPKLVTALQAQREQAEGHEAVALLGRIAKIVEERLGSRQQAFTVWREALLIDPADDNVRAQGERLALNLEKHVDLAEAWLEADKRAPQHDTLLRSELLKKAATLFDEDIDDQAKARMAWRRLLDLDPTNVETAWPAARALERLYQAEENWPALIDMLRRQAGWADSLDGKKEFLRRVGVIQEDLTQDYASAVHTHREILDADAEDAEALDALERLHEAQDQWGDLIGVLRRRIPLSDDPESRRELSWRIAELTEKRLGLHPGSGDVISAYTAILDEHPEDLPTLDALGRLYEAAERPADLLEILERRLLLEKTVAGRVALRGRLAALHSGPLARPEQALERYREMVADDPDNEAARIGLERMLADEDLRLRAAEVLEPIYEGKGDGKKLIQLCELWAAHASDPRDRVQRLRRVAGLRLQAGETRDAFDALGRAARIAVGEPELAQLLDGLESLAHMQSANAQTELVALYRELGSDILDAAVQERVYLTVAAESRTLGDRATAREYYRKVLDASNDHVKALDALEALYLEGGENEQLLEIYSRRADLAADDDERRAHYLALVARLCREKLERPADAVAAYEQILQIYPADDDAADALDGLYASSGRFADLADLLERRLGFADDVEAAVAVHSRLGEIYEKELNDTDRAVENYRAALGGNPDHAPAIAALERFLDDVNHRVDAAEVLEPVYASRHDWRALIRIYEIRLEAADDPARRLALTKRIARAYEEQLEDLAAAFRWYGKVFREDPADRLVRDQLARLASHLNAWEDLAAIYDDFLADTYEESAVTVDVLRLAAQIHDARLNSVDRAKASYQRLLRHDARDLTAFASLESLLSRASRWTDLLEVYREAAEQAPGAVERKAILHKVCRVQEESLKDSDAAIDAWRAVLDVDGEDAPAIAALDRLYNAASRWHDLVDLLSRQLEKAAGPARVGLKLRLGALYEKQLEDLPSAIDAYEEVLTLSPSQKDAAAALERLIMNHDQRFRVAQILEPIYKREDQWAKLVVIYDAELEFIDDKAHRVELLQEIARLHGERGGDRKLAFAALSRAWSEEAPEGESREAPLYQRLVETAGALGTWGDLVGVLEAAVEGSYDFDLAARVHARVADIHEHRMRDAAAAIASWRKVVGVREDDVTAWKALERLLAQLGRTQELVAVLEKRSELSNEMTEQKALAYRAADLYERTLSDPEKAIVTWRHVLTLDEDDRPALAALARLYQSRQAWRDLAWVHGRQIELAVNEADRRPLRFAMAKVFEENLADAFEAITAYKGALDANPRDVEALAALTRLYEKEGMWPDLLEALDAMALLHKPGDARDQVRFRAARVLEEKQNEAEAAIDRYRVLLDDAPDHEGARKALEALVEKEETREAASQVLEPLYRMRGDFQPLIGVYELKLKDQSDPSERRVLLAGIAELYEAGVEDLVGAFKTWARLLAEEPTDEDAVSQLERLAQVRGAWRELAALYEERFDAVFDTEVQRHLALQLAALYETRLSDDAQAISRYRKALDLQGDEIVPLAALDRLLTRSGKPADLAEILEREAQAVSQPDEQAEFLFRLGELRRGQLADMDGALSAYRDALDRAPRHAGARSALEAMLGSPAHAGAALDILEPLYDSDGNHAKRVALAEARLTITTEKPRRASELQRIARIHEEDLKDHRAALSATVRALAELPDDVMLADEIERLGAGDLMSVAASAFDSVLDGGVPSETGRELGLRAARLYGKLGDEGRAEARYVAVLDVDTENVEALTALDGIYRSLGDPAQLVDILDRRAELEMDLDAKKKMFAESARLREEALGDADAAVKTWKKVLDADEADRAALTALASLHEAASRWPELVETLEAQARFADSPSDQVQLKGRIAALYADKLNDLDKAVEAYRDLLDLAPDSLAAMAKLEELHGRRNDWLAVQEVLVRKLSAVAAGRDQVPIYRRLASIAIEHQKAPEDAIGYFQQILDVAPDDAKAAQELHALLAQLEKWYDLVDALKSHADKRGKAGDKDGEIAALVEAADILERKLESPEQATEILETILSRDARNVRALTGLAKIYEASKDFEKCKEILEKAIALATTGADRAELEFRLGRLAEEQGGAEAGEPFYRRALEALPDHAGASAAVEKAARERNDWATVAEMMERRSGGGDVAARKTMLVELAGLYSTKLARPDAALSAMEKARALAPDDTAVLEPLADAYFNAGRLSDALPVYQSLIEKIGKGRRTKELARLHYRLGAIAEKEGKTDLAQTQYQSAYQIDAGHAPTLAALARLYQSQKEWEKARRIYRSMLLQNLDPSAGISKADVYLQLGLIHEQVPGEAPKAVGMYERGLEIEPANTVLKEAIARARAAR